MKKVKDLKKSFVLIVILNLSLAFSIFSAPVINSFSPLSGSVGSTVIINGSGFNTLITNNIVFFGATKSTVTSATATTLTVLVPAGAAYQPISVSDISTGLSAYSQLSFLPTFPGTSGIDADLFSDQISINSGNGPYCVTIGDLDGDGKPDFAVANFSSDNISVFRNTSINNIVSFASKLDISTGAKPISISMSDFDGDGKTDIAIANYGSSNISILHNTSTNGTINFEAASQITTNTNPRNIAIGDFNSDGKQDLAIVNFGANSVTILQNNSSPGSIAFGNKQELTTGNNPYSIGIVDLDGDGKSDLFVGNGNTSAISTFRNISTAGNIIFDTKLNFTTGDGVVSSAFGDLDGDGKTDIVVTNSISNTISILRNNSTIGNISFEAKIDYESNTFPTSVSIGDLDGDGKPDIAVANFTSSTVSLFHNICATGKILFDKALYFTFLNPRGVTISDLDADGKSDIIVANNSSSVTYVKNISAPPTISYFTPTTAIIGTHLIIYGDNFKSTTTVNFGSIPATSFIVNSSTKITAIVPAGESGTISVTTHRGTAQLVGFTYDPNSKPAISSFSPTASSPGATITIKGTKFLNVISVSIGNNEAISFEVVSPETITAVVPSSCTSGKILIKTVGGNDSISGFIYLPLITINSISPENGIIGSSITITGSNFNSKIDKNVVYFGATKANLTNASSTSLTVTVPYGTTFQPISITDTTVGLSAYFKNPFIINNLFRTNIDKLSFDPISNFESGDLPYTIAIGDLDGDGKPEAVTANFSNSSISVFHNNSIIGTTSFENRIDLKTNLKPISISIGDLDGDGKPELIVANYGDNTISIFQNKSVLGNLMFAEKKDYYVEYSPRNISIGDIDNDGKPDLAVVNFASNSVSLLRNISTIGFISFDNLNTLATSGAPYGISVCDFDDDKLPDIAVCSAYSNSVSIYHNISTLGNFKFDPRISYSSDAAPVNLSTGDLDGDNKAEIILTNSVSNTISIFHNKSDKGSISFDNQIVYATGLFPMSVSIGDLNGDGKQDLAIANYNSPNISILQNTSDAGKISFNASIDYSFINSRGVSICDLNGDGRNDIAIANNTKNFSVLNNSNPELNSLTSAIIEPEFEIYPNPVDDYLYIKNNNKKSVNIKIFNNEAKLILDFQNNNDKINLQWLRSGIYFICIDSYRYKIIKN